MDAWANREWHYEVHHHFGEQLVYYLLRVRPFEAEVVLGKLTGLLNQRELESVRIFKVFGSSDLLIRAWLHSQVTRDFPAWLKESLVYAIDTKSFTVNELQIIASPHPRLLFENNSELLDSVYDEETIRAVQDGQDDALLDRLIDAGIVLTREQTGPDPIKFFLAVHLDLNEERIQADAADSVCACMREHEATISKVSVYRGTGFCHILVKGEVLGPNFFSVGEVIDWIYKNLRKYNATTETYLVASPRALVETPDTVSDATLKAFAGRDPFTFNIIPELYDRHYRHHREIERFIESVGKRVILSNRKLVREYLLGHLDGRPQEMKKVLFIYFEELEECLRESHQEFIGKNQLVVREVYDNVKLAPESRKHIALGDLLKIIGYVIKTKQLSSEDLGGNWNDISELRNKLSHADLNLAKDWAKPLETLLLYSLRMTNLVSLILRCTGEKRTFTYLFILK